MPKLHNRKRIISSTNYVGKARNTHTHTHTHETGPLSYTQKLTQNVLKI